MKIKGKLEGKEIILERDLGISNEVEVEIYFPEREADAFGIWKDRDDIKGSIDWIRTLREKEWQRR